MTRIIRVITCVVLSSAFLHAEDEIDDTRGRGWEAPSRHDEGLIEKFGRRVKSIQLNLRGLSRVRRYREMTAPGASAPPPSGMLVREPGRGVFASRGAETHVSSVAEMQALHADLLPPAADNSRMPCFPPIFDQGALNSCTSVATTYYQLTHMVGLARGWDQRRAGPEKRFSPAWTFNLINSGNNRGSFQSRAYAALMSHGAATIKDMPYRGAEYPRSNYRSWPEDPGVWQGALDYRIEYFGVLQDADPDVMLKRMKLLLLNGHVLTAATSIDGWNRVEAADNPYSWADQPGVGQSVATKVTPGDSKHCITIVGYNDDLWVDLDADGLVEPDELGALKIANSWGRGDWNGGFRWLHYSALRPGPGGKSGSRELGLVNNQVFWIQPMRDYSPALVLQLDLPPVYRDEFRIMAGVGAGAGEAALQNGAPNFAFNYNGGRFSFSGGAKPEAVRAVLDLTTPVLRYGKPDAELMVAVSRRDGQALVPRAHVVEPMTGTARELELRAAPDAGGFLAVLPVGLMNATSVADVTLPAQVDLPVGEPAKVAVGVKSRETKGSGLVYKVFSSNASVLAVRDLSIVLDSQGRPALFIKPQPDAHGTSLLTVHVSDGWSSKEAQVRVNLLRSGEIAPSVVASPPVTNGLKVSIPFRVNPGSDKIGNAFVFFDASNVDLISSYTFTGSGEERVLELRLLKREAVEIVLSAAVGPLTGTTRLTVGG